MIEEHIKTMLPLRDEKQKRLFLASLAKEYGRGGVKKVCETSGCSPHTAIKGKKELEDGVDGKDPRVRKDGGGRKKLEAEYPRLPRRIEEPVSGSACGNPENPLAWTTKSLRTPQQALLSRHGVYVSFRSIGTRLENLGYSLQSNRKMLQTGESHPDRNTQFEYINATAKEFLTERQPVISVDTKKKELAGNYANNGQEYSASTQKTSIQKL
jgi:hypothetical protein